MSNMSVAEDVTGIKRSSHQTQEFVRHLECKICKDIPSQPLLALCCGQIIGRGSFVLSNASIPLALVHCVGQLIHKASVFMATKGFTALSCASLEVVNLSSTLNFVKKQLTILIISLGIQKFQLMPVISAQPSFQYGIPINDHNLIHLLQIFQSTPTYRPIH